MKSSGEERQENSITAQYNIRVGWQGVEGVCAGWKVRVVEYPESGGRVTEAGYLGISS